MFQLSPRKIGSAVALVAVLATGCTEIVRVTTTGSDAAANGPSRAVALSVDGNLVAFESNATNLVANDTNNVSDIFVRDRDKGVVQRVSVATGGAQANGASVAPDISDDGRYVAFVSSATNIGSGEQGGTEPDGDVFVHDRTTGTTRLLSKLPDGTHPASLDAALLDLSPDGSTALFSVRDDPSALVYRVVVATGAVSIEVPRSACPPDASVGAVAALSTDGTRVLYGFDCNIQSLTQLSTARVVIKDRSTGVSKTLWRYDFEFAPSRFVVVTQVSLSHAGSSGAWVIAQATGPTTSDFFGFGWLGNTPPLQLHAGDQVPNVAIAPGGRYVAYMSGTGRFSRIADVALYDLLTNERYSVSVNTNGENTDATPNGNSSDPSWSGDGSLIAFVSDATDLVPNDTNGVTDGFVRPLSSVLAGAASQTATATATAK
jgi:dipeptidyl aminopeptidase/acylaminoacyl peptidase